MKGLGLLGASLLANSSIQPGQNAASGLGNAYGTWQRAMTMQKEQQFLNQYRQAQMQNMQIQQAQAQRQAAQDEKADAAKQQMNEYFAGHPELSKLPPALALEQWKTGQTKPSQTADIQNYNYYAAQEQATGRKPLSYQQWRMSGKSSTNFSVNPDGTVNFSQGVGGVPGDVAGDVPKVTDLQRFTDAEGNPPPHAMNYQQLMEGGYRLRSDTDLAGTITPIEKQRKAKEKVSSTLREMGNIYTTLDENNAIRNADKSVGENVMAYMKNTGPGQELQKMGGGKNQKLRDDIFALHPTVLLAIKDAADMGVKMMDTPAEMEFYLKMATNPNLDVGTNRLALDVVEAGFGNDEARYREAKARLNGTRQPGAMQDTEIDAIMKRRSNGNTR